MAIIIAITNQKGGVGKTTTTVNLSASLASKGKKVLTIDLDPQGNATTGSGINKSQINKGIYHVLLNTCDIQEAIVHSKAGHYDVLCANRALAGAEVELVQEIARELRLKNALNSIKNKYDYIIIDCPPTLTLLTINGLVASDGVIVPMVCEYYALEGISDLLATLRKIRQSGINPNLEIYGVLKTLFDTRSNLSQDVSAQLDQYFKDKVFNTIIPRNIRLAEAPSHGMPALAYDPKARGSIAYLELAEEIIKQLEV